MTIEFGEHGVYGTQPYGVLTVNETSIDIANNKSTVSFNLVLKRPSNIQSSATKNASCTIDGQTYNWSGRIGGSGDLTLISGTKDVYHNTDGSKSIYVSASIQLDLTWSGVWVGTISGNGNLTLTTIPRASSISATSVDIGSNTTISINRASNSFTHTITYSFGSLSGTIATKTSNTSIQWTVPSTFYAQIPNAKSGTCTLTCITYSGDTQIGTSQTTFKATANEDICKPIVSGSVSDINPTTIALTGETSKLVKYKSIANLGITSTPKNSATIIRTLVNGNDYDGTPIEKVETGNFEIIVIDSRGYQGTTTLTCPIVNYIPLSATSLFKRLSNTSNKVNLTYSGNYWNGDFGVENNSLSLTYKYREKGSQNWINGTSTLNPTITDYKFNVTIELAENFDYRKNWEFSLFYEDELTSGNTGINNVLKGNGALEIYESAVNVNGDLIGTGKVEFNGKRIDNYYSTTETKIGTWTNGKPIYRKVIETNLPNQNVWSIVASISNVDEITEPIRGIFIASDGRIMPINHTEEGYQVSCTFKNGNIEIKQQNSLWNNCDCHIIIDYTKTTD